MQYRYTIVYWNTTWKRTDLNFKEKKNTIFKVEVFTAIKLLDNAEHGGNKGMCMAIKKFFDISLVLAWFFSLSPSLFHFDKSNIFKFVLWMKSQYSKKRKKKRKERTRRNKLKSIWKKFCNRKLHYYYIP